MATLTAIKVTTLSGTESTRGTLVVQAGKAQTISAFGKRETTEAVISVITDVEQSEGIHLVIEDPHELARLVDALKRIKIQGE